MTPAGPTALSTRWCVQRHWDATRISARPCSDCVSNRA